LAPASPHPGHRGRPGAGDVGTFVVWFIVSWVVLIAVGLMLAQ
jgi:hypothetical protein